MGWLRAAPVMGIRTRAPAAARAGSKTTEAAQTLTVRPAPLARLACCMSLGALRDYLRKLDSPASDSHVLPELDAKTIMDAAIACEHSVAGRALSARAQSPSLFCMG
jgi:hypothetical protein